MLFITFSLASGIMLKLNNTNPIQKRVYTFIFNFNTEINSIEKANDGKVVMLIMLSTLHYLFSSARIGVCIYEIQLTLSHSRLWSMDAKGAYHTRPWGN